MGIDIRKIFFENIGIKQTILKNTFWLILSEAITGILRLVLLIYVARVLGATEYGKFTFALSFVSVLAIFADLGIINTFTREFSRDKEKENKLSALFSLEIILSIGTLILITIGSFFITNDPVVRKTIWMLAFFILITNFLGIFYSFLRARQKMEYEAGVKITQTLLILVFSFFALFSFRSVVGLSFGFFISNIITLIVFLVFFHFYFQPLKFIYDKNIFKPLKISWPLSFGFMVSWIYMSVSSIILGYFGLITENGWYSAASKVSLIAIMPATFIALSFYPALSNFFITSKEKLQNTWNFLMEIMIFLTVPILFGGIILAPKIIGFIYGSNFNPSIYIFQILTVAVCLNFINYPYSLILVISDQQKKNFAVMIVGILINIFLNFILIQTDGLLGVVIATVASSFITLVLTIVVSKYFSSISIFDLKLFKKMIIAIFSGTIMALAIFFASLWNFNIIFCIVLGVIVYFFVLYLLYFFKKNCFILR